LKYPTSTTSRRNHDKSWRTISFSELHVIYDMAWDGAYTGVYSPWTTFADRLKTSRRVLCLVGAGLSAPSGLATWRGANGLWNNIELRELATPNKFQEDPVASWCFYGERLLETLAAQPNAAHHALATLAKWHPGWLTISQNVDGTDREAIMREGANIM
jgi:NAD+-dependent protein deacetylase sirtuin 5